MNILEALEKLKTGHFICIKDQDQTTEFYIQMAFTRDGQPLSILDNSGCEYELKLLDLKCDEWKLYGIADF